MKSPTLQFHYSAHYRITWYTVRLGDGVWTANTRSEADTIIAALVAAR